ncbi:MAG: winged helix-turn-helix domain-containing protein [Blastocatellia bacterium]
MARFADDPLMNEKTLCYQFDDIHVDPHEFRAWRGGQPLSLEPKALESLLYLLTQPGRLVEKDELLREVWRDAFVTPNALTRVIAQLRKTLGDDVRAPRYIETVPTRGYRFIADVQMVERAEAHGAAAVSPSFAIPDIAPDVPADFVAKQLWRTGFARMAERWKIVCVLAPLLLMSGVWLWGEWPAVVSPAVIGQTRQLTTNAGLDIFPAFSPDGGAVAYASLRNGRFDLFLRQLAPGGREIQLTADDGENLQPAWSPDGRQIVYHARRRGGLWVIPALGGLARRLTDFGSRPAWAPDGASIVFQSDSPVDLSQTGFGAFATSSLWIVPANGGTPRRLTHPGQPAGGHGAPAWSPDSHRIVFVSYGNGGSGLWSVSPDGHQLTLLRKAPALHFDPVFASDGRHLYFSMASGNFRLLRMELTAAGQPVGPATEISNTGNALVRHLSIASDGKRLVCSLLSAHTNIASIQLSPGAQQAVGAPVALTRDTSFRKTAQAFSPDGATIAYSVWRLGSDGEIWLMDAAGGNARPLTTKPAVVLGWTPGGAEIILNQKADSESRIVRVNAVDGQQTLLAARDFGTPFGRLAPGGAEIAFHRLTDGALNIWKATLDTGATRQLTFDREMMGFPTWAPDGRRLAVEMQRGDDRHIAILSADGGAAEQLTATRGQSWPGGWSPNGNRISFAGLRDGVWNIWWVDRHTKQQQQLTQYETPNSYVRYPAWSPRGDQIVYEYAETTGNVWMFELK